MKVLDVLECSFDNWYEQFEKVTIKSEILPIPDNVLTYLQDNGKLVLPSECDRENFNCTEEDYDDFGDVDWEARDNTEPQEAEDPEATHHPTFPEFSSKVKNIIKDLGGAVFCKLNWSSPKDAIWMAYNNSARCCSLSDIYLLLKSSDFVAHDLTQPFKDCLDGDSQNEQHFKYVLVLRKWRDINPGIEFRCFVRDGNLIAISQRDNTNYYDHMSHQKCSIINDICTFFREFILNKFPINSFVFDVIRPGKDQVKLLDFNPFGVTTDGLLFEWDELREMPQQDDPVFRFITDSAGVQPHPLRHYSLPQDMVDLASGTDPHKLIDFLSLKTRRENGQPDSDSDCD